MRLWKGLVEVLERVWASSEPSLVSLPWFSIYGTVEDQTSFTFGFIVAVFFFSWFIPYILTVIVIAVYTIVFNKIAFEEASFADRVELFLGHHIIDVSILFRLFFLLDCK